MINDNIQGGTGSTSQLSSFIIKLILAKLLHLFYVVYHLIFLNYNMFETKAFFILVYDWVDMI